MAEFMYYLLVISIHKFSSIIMIIFLLATLVRIKHWNLFAVVIFGPDFVLMYNNSTSPVVKNERRELFIFLTHFFLSIYFPLFLFLELGLGLELQDHAVTQQVIPADMVTSHMTHGRR